MNWRPRARTSTGAIHFHDDDMIDARLGDRFQLHRAERSTQRAVYAAMLEAGGAQFQVAFLRTPAQGTSDGRQSSISLRSATYTVYCNNIGRYPFSDDRSQCRAA